MGVEGLIRPEGFIGHKRKYNSRHSCKLQCGTDILQRDTTGKTMERGLDGEKDDHTHCENDGHTFLLPENKTSDEEGNHPRSTSRESWIPSTTVAALEKEGQPDTHGGKSGNEEKGVYGLCEPGTKISKDRPQRERTESRKNP